MTKKQIKEVISNYDNTLKVVAIRKLDKFEKLEASAICVTDNYFCVKFWFYKDNTFRLVMLEEPVINDISYHKTNYYLNKGGN